ncbi:hypothetical protein FJTKL_14255 [Diaporthe vaccinii]|uniref:Major facilitator superfamily (MFS) profile domain-containing protein n=1 Tax=Diaporthe vaccinii TaxID=105482 RepID=A0ABR4E8E0_9PEZI
MHRTSQGFKAISELWTHPRTRYAMLASITVMFLQQLCGINVLAYYSTTLIQDTFAKKDLATSLPSKYSLGFRVINFAVALVAVPLVDWVGRRNLLLASFPFLALFQFLMAALSSTEGMVAAMYLFCAVYSLGEGPVPFVYASECFPLHHRVLGMGLATSVTWIFNFLLAVTWPVFNRDFGKPGAFSWYGGWCVVGWFMVLVRLCPRDKRSSLGRDGRSL